MVDNGVRDEEGIEADGVVLPPERELRDHLLAVSPVPIAVVDSEGRVVLTNERARTELGLTENELLGMSPGHPGVELRDEDGEPLSATDAVSSRVLQTGSAVYDEVYRVRLPNDETLWLSVSGIPLRDGDGAVAAAVLAFENITERKVREQQLELRSERLEEFATIVSHELRNPLNIVQGYIDRVDLDRNGDDADLDRIDRALDRMELLVEKLLQMPRVSTDYEFEPVDVGRFVEDCWAAVATPEATLVVGDDLPTVVADSHRLRVLFEHLFRNAVQHGGRDVTVEVGGLDGDEGFYVADDGPGFPDGEYAMAFDRTYSTDGDDPGFGLVIVRSVVEDHGWDVRAVESDGGGARFEVYTHATPLSTFDESRARGASNENA